MNSSSSNECRQYLIAIGSPSCPHMNLPSLTHVEQDIAKVTDLFQKQGYQRVLSDQIDIGDTAPNIKNAMVSWFSSSERRASDCVVVYYGGHGDEGGRFGQHYLFTVESTETKLSTKAIKTREFIECFFQGDRNTSPQNILLILDTCYANAGIRQSFKELSELRGIAPEGSGFWVISSSNSLTEAGDGAFVEALCAVMCPKRKEWQKYGEFIPVESLVSQINQQFETNGQAQRAITDAIGIQKQSIFFINPRLITPQEIQEGRKVSSQVSQLIDRLWSLDYTPQSRMFEDYTKEKPLRRIAAFVVQAKDRPIQHWLVKRLFKKLKVNNAKVFPFEIPAHPIYNQRNFNELWIDLGKKLKCDAKKDAVLNILAEIYQTKPIILAMYGWDNSARSQALQQQMLTNFWEPLVSKIKSLPNQPKSRLILFLAEEGTKDPNGSDDEVLPICLNPLTKITLDHIETWLEEEEIDKILGEDHVQVLREEIIYWDPEPAETIQQICYRFGMENGIAEIEPEWRLAG